ncbi:MAG: redoxin domain-containing protein [Planctomycetota bacterium]
MGLAPHLVEIHEKYGPQGFVVLALTSDPKSTLEKFIKDKGITYRIGVDDKREAAQAYSGNSIPRSWLVDTEGTVVWNGHPASLTESMIEEQLKNVLDTKLRDVVPALAPAKADFEKKKFGDAWGKAQKVLANEKAPEADKADAQYVADEVTKRAETALAVVEQKVSTRQFPKAIQKLKEIALLFKGTEWEKAASGKRKTIEADPDAKKELEAQGLLEKLLAQEKGIKKAKDKKKFLSNYLTFVKKYEGTQAAAQAQARIEAINQMGD